jgi:hypothetical protein
MISVSLHCNAIGINAVFRAIFDTLHDPLHRPKYRARFQLNGQIDFSLGITVVAAPLTFTLPTNDFTDLGAKRENTRTQMV